MAEHSIQVLINPYFLVQCRDSLFQMVKRRLYRLCRSLRTENWPKYLAKVVEALNNTPNSAIGYLKPVEIKSPLDDPKVDSAVGGAPEDVPVAEQKANQIKYEEGNDLQVNDHVYLDFPPSTMAKGFDTPVSTCKFVKFTI